MSKNQINIKRAQRKARKAAQTSPRSVSLVRLKVDDRVFIGPNLTAYLKQELTVLNENVLKYLEVLADQGVAAAEQSIAGKIRGPINEDENDVPAETV